MSADSGCWILTQGLSAGTVEPVTGRSHRWARRLPGRAMTDKRPAAPSGQSNAEKDPSDWVTGDEPMTGAQRSYLKTLSEEAKVDFDESLSKADASRRIEELQKITGRGRPPNEEPSPAADELDVDGDGARQT
jgi:hypothetical protein